MRYILNTMIVLAAVAAMQLAAIEAYAADTYEVDPVHSAVIFKANHLGISNIYGRFNDFSGTVVMDEDNPENSSITIKVQAGSVDTNSKDRDTHLRGPDFFNAKQFPVISFTSTAVNKLKGNQFAVTGELSLHGESKVITIEVTRLGKGSDPWGGYRAGWEAMFAIDRTAYGMDYGTEGSGDFIQLTVALEGIRK